jgi:large subunit ribosomal protein L17
MRHQIAGKRLSRDAGHRKALATNLTRSLIQHERITTTLAKAQFIRGSTERMITLAKRGLAKAKASNNEAAAVHTRRIAASRLGNDREVVQKLFDVIAPRYADRPGGYTRVYKLGPRKGDNAEMVLIELVDRAAEPADAK